jgi:hypothetical protein
MCLPKLISISMSGSSLSNIISIHLESEQIIVTKTETVIKCSSKTLTSCNSSSAHPIAHPHLQRTANKTPWTLQSTSSKTKTLTLFLAIKLLSTKKQHPKKEVLATKEVFMRAEEKKHNTLKTRPKTIALKLSSS